MAIYAAATETELNNAISAANASGGSNTIQLTANITANTQLNAITVGDLTITSTVGNDFGISGATGIRMQSTGVLTLDTANSFSGNTEIDSGTVRAGQAGSFSASSKVVLTPNGTLDLNNYDQTIGSLDDNNGGSTSRVLLGSATLTTGNDNSSPAYRGTISGTGGLTKIGTGTIQLVGNNEYTGTTTANAGRFVIQSQSSASQTLILNGSSQLTILDHNNSLSGTTDLIQNGNSIFEIIVSENIGSLNGTSGAALYIGNGAVLTTGTNNINDIYAG